MTDMLAPETMRILNITYTVRPMTEIERNGDSDAACYSALATIVYNDTLNRNYIDELLWHEALHGLWAAAKLDDSATEEDVVGRITPLLLRFICDNPRMLARLGFVSVV